MSYLVVEGEIKGSFLIKYLSVLKNKGEGFGWKKVYCMIGRKEGTKFEGSVGEGFWILILVGVFGIGREVFIFVFELGESYLFLWARRRGRV